VGIGIKTAIGGKKDDIQGGNLVVRKRAKYDTPKNRTQPNTMLFIIILDKFQKKKSFVSIFQYLFQYIFK